MLASNRNYGQLDRLNWGYELAHEPMPRRAMMLGVVNVDLVITPASVLAQSGATFGSGTAGEVVLAGQTLYQNTTDSKYYLADADASGKDSVKGIALHAAATGQPIRFITAGKLTAGATVAVGVIYVNSDTAGGIMPSADLDAGDKVSILGIGINATTIEVDITNSGIAFV